MADSVLEEFGISTDHLKTFGYVPSAFDPVSNRLLKMWEEVVAYVPSNPTFADLREMKLAQIEEAYCLLKSASRLIPDQLTRQ